EYAINGNPCRLLDVQELLSDSGIGREMHVIVGQGQLDSVLSASPEERRGFIEEAAGVLKHRKRKEKALRKLDAMQANLVRAQDPWYRLSSLRERLRGTAGLAAERTRHLAAAPAEERRGRDPEDMEAEARRIRAEEAELSAELAEAKAALETAVMERTEA